MTDFDYQKTGSMDQEIIDDTDEYHYMGRHIATTEVGNKFAKSVVALMIVIPLLVIFSPVLAAAIPLAAVFLASGVVSVTVARVMEWLLSKNVTRPNLLQSNQSVERAERRHFDMVYDDRYVTDYESLDGIISLLIHVVKESFINSVGGVYGKALRWIYKYMKGEHPIGADTLDRATREIGSKYREMRDDQDRYGSGAKQELLKATAGGSLVFLSALTFTGTVITLAMAGPVFVIFSPVLVPALISVFLLAIGFLSSGMFGVAGVSVLTWLYKYVSGGGRPVGAELLDRVFQKFGLKDQEMRDEGEIAVGGETSEKLLNLEIIGTSEHTIRGSRHTALEDRQKLMNSVVALLVAAPILLILSPLLVPMMIAILMLGTLCLAAGAFSAVATRMYEWAYNFVTGGRQSRTSLMDERTHKVGLRERGEQKIEEGLLTAAVGGESGLSMTLKQNT